MLVLFSFQSNNEQQCCNFFRGPEARAGLLGGIQSALISIIFYVCFNE